MDRRKYGLNIAFLVLVFGATLYYVFHGEDLEQLTEYIQLSDPRYWILAITFVLIFIIGESVILFYLLRSMKQTAVFFHCCLYSFIGFFFSCITPSASGGQPMQLLYMKKDGQSVAISTYILLIVTIGYKMVLVLLGLGVLILQPSSVISFLRPVYGWILLGILLNVITIGFMLLLLFHASLAKTFLRGLLFIGCKIGVIKEKKEWEGKIESLTDRYAQVSGYLKQNPVIGLNVLLLSIVQRFALFAVPAVIYASFGFGVVSPVRIAVLQGMISVAVDMLPTPGGMGISEGLFLVIFEPIFGVVTLPALVVSRGISFYSQIAICLVMTIVAHIVISKRSIRGKGQ